MSFFVCSTKLTEEDLQDPDLLGELGEMAGGVVDFGKPKSQKALSVGGERGGGGGGGGRRGKDEPDEDTVEPDVEGDDDLDALGDLMDDDAPEVKANTGNTPRFGEPSCSPFGCGCLSFPSTRAPYPKSPSTRRRPAHVSKSRRKTLLRRQTVGI